MTAIHLNPVAVSSVALLRAIRAGGWSNQTELAKVAGRSPKNIARDLTILRNADLLADGDDIALSDIGDLQLDAIDRAESGEDKPGSPERVRFPQQVGDIRLILHSDIRPDPANARTDWDSDEAKDDLDALRQDIIQVGLLQNLVVRPSPAGVVEDGGQPWTLIGGERRWRAIGLALFDDDWPADRPLPCRVIDVDEMGQRLAALSENLQRRNLNPLEKARAFEGLANTFAAMGVEEGRINREIADRVGVTIEHVQQHRSFMRLDEADQVRLTLPKDDPRRLSVSEARKRVAEATKAEAVREELQAIPPEERLAAVEVMHAVAARAHYSYADIAVQADAKDSKIGQALAGMGWVVFGGPVEHGDRNTLGHYVVKRTSSIPADLSAPFWSSNEHERDAALRAAQAEAGHPDRSDYVTAWLNGPFELTEDGAAIVQADTERRERQAEDEARRVAEREAAEAERAAEQQRARDAAARTRELFAVHRTTPPPAPVVAELAAAADAKLPWRRLHNGDIVAADGEVIISGRSDWAEARMRLVILAINAAGGFETPEDEPDPNPVLDEDTFVRRMADALTVHSYQTPGAETFVDAAARFLAEFLSDNGVAFGGDGWDWTAVGAEHLAVEAMTAEAQEAEEGEEAEQAYAAADHEGQD